MKSRTFHRCVRKFVVSGVLIGLLAVTACRQPEPKSPEIDQEDTMSEEVSASNSNSSDSSWEDLDEEESDSSSLDSPGDSTTSSQGTSIKTTHEVQPGENLWSIAEKYYGRGIYWRAIRNHNNLGESGQINAGQTIEIPELSQQQKDRLRSRAASASGGSTSTSSDGQSGSASSTYVTKQGDTFWKIAERVYGNGEQWKRIWRANKSRVPNPDKLKAGTKIKIPGEGDSSVIKGQKGQE